MREKAPDYVRKIKRAKEADKEFNEFIDKVTALQDGMRDILKGVIDRDDTGDFITDLMTSVVMPAASAIGEAAFSLKTYGAAAILAKHMDKEELRDFVNRNVEIYGKLVESKEKASERYMKTMGN